MKIQWLPGTPENFKQWFWDKPIQQNCANNIPKTGSLQQGACSQIHRKTPTPTLGTKRTRVSASTQHCIHACVLAKVFKEHVTYYIYKKNGARFAEVGYCCFSSHTTVEPWHPIRFYLCAPGKEHNHRLKLFPGLLPRHIIFLGLSIVAPSWFRLVAVHPSPKIVYIAAQLGQRKQTLSRN